MQNNASTQLFLKGVFQNQVMITNLCRDEWDLCSDAEDFWSDKSDLFSGKEDFYRW